MRVLVSGASGLIGRALTRRLETGDHQVVRLVRPGSAAVGGGPTVTYDPAAGHLDLGELAAAGPYDAVVNLAGAGIGDRRWTAARKAELEESRIGVTGLVTRAAAALAPAPRVVVSASAVGYYGDRGDEELTESSPAGGGFLADLCRSWEAAALPAAEAGIRTVLLRTGIVLSASGGALGKQLPLFKLGLGGRLGSGRQYTSWITLDDEVAVIERALGDESLVGPVNATAPHPVTNAELTAAIGRALHRPAVLVVPSVALRMALGAEMADEMLLSGQRVLPAALEGAGHAFSHPDLPGALAAVLHQRP